MANNKREINTELLAKRIVNSLAEVELIRQDRGSRWSDENEIAAMEIVEEVLDEEMSK